MVLESLETAGLTGSSADIIALEDGKKNVGHDLDG